MDQLKRIKYMEQILNEGIAAVAALDESLAAYHTLQSRLQDLGDDQAGKLPADLRRDVLSEDAIWNLETSNLALISAMQDFLVKHQHYPHK